MYGVCLYLVQVLKMECGGVYWGKRPIMEVLRYGWVGVGSGQETGNALEARGSRRQGMG